jgi:Protein of unknown function (DUF3987)/Bifunctional DNA primase/polymerase, N-terminal
VRDLADRRCHRRDLLRGPLEAAAGGGNGGGVTAPVLEAALEAHAVGLCVLPPTQDGTKRPNVSSWTQYQQRRATEPEIRDWYRDGRTGLGIVTGRVSSGLEMIEFEGRAIAAGRFEAFLALAEADGLDELVNRIRAGYQERTPSGGLHLLYQVPTALGNTQLAKRPATPEELAENPDDKIKVLIETRGEGGYVVTAPSNGRVHPTGRAWSLEAGGFGTIVMITDEERDRLFGLARALDEMPPPAEPAPRHQHPGDSDGERPGDRFNAAPDVQERVLEVLKRHGWTWVYSLEGVDYLRRPGKEAPGISASLGHVAPGVLRVFSTSTIFEARAHSPFSVYGLLEHGGDFAAAAAALEPPITIVGTGGPGSAPAEPETRIEPAAWPDPPADAAYHGVVGDLVTAVAPYTEADPVALLATILTIFGALAGDAKTFYQGSQQRANLFTVLVGDSSTGRKGTAQSVVREIMTATHPGWDGIVAPGVGSGEGLVGHLKRNEETEHRALVIETEFGRLLRVMGREGSTLSPILRDAFDGAPLGRILARDSAIVTRHHVACLAHVTGIELRDKLTEVDAANGFGNRFLFLAVRRSRLVPFPQSPRSLISPHVEALHRAIVEAQAPGELAFTAAAADRWEWLYAELPTRRALGLVGALTARAEAQIARLALVYALLDRSAAIEADHLEAAEAMWDYAARSARFVFGDSTGNRHADFVLRLLRREGELDRQVIKQETGLRLGADIDAVESVLVGAGLAVRITVPRPGGGRPRRVLRLTNGANGANRHEDAQGNDRGPTT